MRSRPFRFGALLPAVVLAASATACRPPTVPPGRPPQAPGTFAPVAPVPAGAASVPIGLDPPACGAPDACLAVPPRPTDAAGRPARFGEAWDGTRWSPVAAPGHSVRALTCVGRWCLALSGTSRDLGETVGASTWDGRTWTRVPPPDGLDPADVDCWAVDACVVVGDLADRRGAALRWDGRVWTPIDGGRTAASRLGEVDCPAAEDCLFLGKAPADVERWRAGTWTVVSDSPVYDLLSCVPGGALCLVRTLAAGAPTSSPFGVLVLRPSRPDEMVPTDGSYVGGLACGSDGCVVTTDTGTVVGDGTTWTRGPARRAGDRPAIECPTTQFCAAQAGGLSSIYETNVPPVFEHWDGRAWLPVTATPNPTEPKSSLDSVSCVAADVCVAVGQAVEGTRILGLAERWDGRRWTLLATPPAPAGRHLDLRTVSCTRVDRCVTVGATAPVGDRPPVTDYLYDTPYVARFDGRVWTDETAALPAGDALALTDVSCTGGWCLAVGVREPGPDPDGQFHVPWPAAAFVSDAAGSWRTAPGPPMGPNVAYGGLPGRAWLQVECARPTSCAASSVGTFPFGVLTETAYWNGTAWSEPPLVPDNAPTRGDPVTIEGVSCPPVGRCLATGQRTPSMGLGEQEGVVLMWDGTAWVPEPAPALPALGPVSCGAPDRCLVLDARLALPTDLRASVVRDTTGWHRVPDRPTIPPALSRGSLADVSCTPTMCLVVGDDGTGALAHRWRF